MRRQLRLAAEMAQSEKYAATQLRGSFGQLLTDMVTPLALVVTEVVANSVEHGFGEGQTDLTVVMEVSRHTDAAGRERLDVEIIDDGVGLPDQDWEPGLGLQIVKTLVRGELSGSIEWMSADEGGGTKAVLRAPSWDEGQENQLARRARAARRFSARRSSSLMPPHTPESCPVSKAHWRHVSMTGHRRHTLFASSICRRAGPVLPTGKKSSGSLSRHAARLRQSTAITAPWGLPHGRAAGSGA